jgi:alpha-D-ribose 1-methylphosphonate 5-triphosphate synthase subunit PhnH
MNRALDLGSVRSGFEHPSLDAQRVFRRVLDAMARPGTVADLSFAPEAPEGLCRALGAIALTLLDFETPLWLDPALRGGEAETWLRFHCGCPLVEAPDEAAFALVVDATALPALDAFALGDARYPDRSTTVLVQLPSLAGGPAQRLEGPGIDGVVHVAPAGLPEDFWARVARNGARFQVGVDLMLAAEDTLLGLPRTVRPLQDATIPEQQEGR